MNWTNRRLAQQGDYYLRDCAPSAWRRALWAILWTTFSVVAGQAVSALADEGFDELATGGLFLQSGSGHQQGAFVGNFHLNDDVGAQRFYDAGFTGSNAVMANIEAGQVWKGHETLGHVNWIPSSPGAVSEADRHATWVAAVMGGRPTVDDAGHDYQRGIAPNAQLFSGAIATSWPSDSAYPRYTASFYVNFSTISTYGPYRAAMITGLSGPQGTRTADVVNSSYIGNTGSTGLTGTDRLAGTLDALIGANPRTLVTLAAGNTVPSGEGPNRVGSPASGYNGLSVAALGPNGGAFDLPSYFSNGGPNDYSDPTVAGGIISAARQVVDIAAPGENFSTAYYGGETGGNGAGLFGAANGPAGGPNWYTRNVSGTSFAAPTVAGGAALLYDAAYAVLGATPDARDARVMKAVLMNSADKTLDWDNGQAAHPNGNGGVLTTQGLDNRVGAGRLNLTQAYSQLLGGTTDVAGVGQGLLGTVDPTGWDFGLVREGTENDYLLDGVLQAGALVNATLSWFRDRATVGTTNFSDSSYDNLDLQLWEASGGAAVNLIAESTSLYNNNEHFSFMLPKSGEYLLRVHWATEIFDLVGDANSEHYGLAWAAEVPEPGTMVLLALAIPSLLMARRRS
jgi:hypothetical protein